MDMVLHSPQVQQLFFCRSVLLLVSQHTTHHLLQVHVIVLAALSR
jgi:hypothetical protein